MINRNFVKLPVDATEELKPEKTAVRIMQWNMLARGLALNDVLPLAKPADFDWNACRLPLMIEEFSRYLPDIASVEELDQKDDLMGRLEPLGYKCLYSPNPDSPCVLLDSEFGPDGVAIIYKHEKVEVLSHELVRLPMPSRWDGTDRHKLALSAVLKLKSCDFKLRFIVVHLKSKKDFAALRVEQFEKLTEYLAELTKKNENEMPTIISGDFNAEPDEPVIKLTIQLGFVSVLPIDGREGVYSTAKFQPSKTGLVRHVRLIDYIFYKNHNTAVPPKLHPTAYLAMPSLADVGPTLLPNGNYPSDHLSLIVDFNMF